MVAKVYRKATPRSATYSKTVGMLQRYPLKTEVIHEQLQMAYKEIATSRMSFTAYRFEGQLVFDHVRSSADCSVRSMLSWHSAPQYEWGDDHTRSLQ